MNHDNQRILSLADQLTVASTAISQNTLVLNETQNSTSSMQSESSVSPEASNLSDEVIPKETVKEIFDNARIPLNTPIRIMKVASKDSMMKTCKSSYRDKPQPVQSKGKSKKY